MLIDDLKKWNLLKTNSVIEFAAGTGRETEHVLLKYFGKIDLLEPVNSLAKGLKILQKKHSKIRKIYIEGAQDFDFEDKYDMVYFFGLLENLSDIDFVKFLIKARDNLNPQGKVIIKENVSPQGIFAQYI